MFKIAVLGCGKMASAILEGIGKNQQYQFFTYSPSGLSAKLLADKIAGKAYKEITDIPKSELYFLACKPQQFSTLASNLKELIPKDALVLSIMASIEVADISSMLGNNRVYRCMPNTPMAIKKGQCTIFGNDKNQDIENLLSKTADIFWCNAEKELDQLMLINGCGPAFVYYLSKMMSESLQNLYPDLGHELVQHITTSMFLGSSSYMKESNIELETLIQNVTSKGGVTIKGIEVLKQHLPAIFAEAFSSMDRQNTELKRFNISK